MAFLSITPVAQTASIYTTTGNNAVSAVTGTALVVRPSGRSLGDSAPRRGNPVSRRGRDGVYSGASAYASQSAIVRGMFYDKVV